MNLKCPQNGKAEFICIQPACTSPGLKCRQGCKQCKKLHEKCLAQQRIQGFCKKINFDNKNATQQKNIIVEALKAQRKTIDDWIKMVEEMDVSKLGIPNIIQKHQDQNFVKRLTGKQFKEFIAIDSNLQIKQNFSPEIINQIERLNDLLKKSKKNMIEFISTNDSKLATIKAEYSILQKMKSNKDKQQALKLIRKFVNDNYGRLQEIIRAKKKLAGDLCFKQSLDNSKILAVLKLLANQILGLFVLSTQLQNYQCALQGKNLLEKIYDNPIEGFQLNASQEVQNKINKTKAQYFVGKKEKEFALAFYEKIQPRTHQLIVKMYELYEDLKGPDQPNIYLEKLYDSKKDNPFALKKVAEFHEKNYRFQEATHYFFQYLRYSQDGDKIQDLQWIAKLLLKIPNNHKQVIRYFNQIIQADNSRLDLMYQIAQIRENVFFDLNNSQATKLYRQIIQASKAKEDLRQGFQIYVVKSYNRLVKLLGNNLDNQSERMKHLHAAVALQKKLKIKYFQTHQALAFEYIKNKSQGFEKAIAQLEICLSIYPKPQIYFWKGKCLMDCRQYSDLTQIQSAQRQFSNAIKFRHHFADAYFLRGKCKLRRKQFEQALEDFLIVKKQSSLEGRPNQIVNKQIFYLIGKCYQELRRSDQALQNYELVLEKDSKHLHARYAKAFVLKETKRIDEAFQIFSDLIRQNTSYKLLALMFSGDIKERIADEGEELPIKKRQQIYQQALELHEKAYEIEKTNETVTNYCRVLEKLGNIEQSKRVRDAYQNYCSHN